MSTCKSCGAEIMWVQSQDNVTMPVNVPGDQRYIFLPINEQDGDRKLPRMRLVSTYLCHFVTCHQTAEHRK